MDALAGKYACISPYVYVANNPIRFIDPDGRAVEDDYYIRKDGTIEKVKTSDTFDRFFLVDSKHIPELVIRIDKNSQCLIQLPKSFSFESISENGSFAFKVKNGNEYRAHIHGDAFAALIGALSETGVKDLTVVGFSLSNGTSPEPSVSHKSGKNGDLRYLRKDKTGGTLYINQNPEDLDEKRQNALNNALYKFGWKDLLSHKYSLNGENKLLNKTRHYINHHHHLHLQGFRPSIKVVHTPNVIYDGGSLEEIIINY